MAEPIELLPPGTGPHDERWHELRRAGVTASEIAVVMGLSPYDSPFNLYWAKLNDWRWGGNEYTGVGSHLEDAIADWWVAQGPDRYTMHAGLYTHPERPWQLATPDRIVIDVWGKVVALLECKWVAQSWDGWGEDGTDDIPVYYRAQVQWQCDVVGVDQWYLAALGPGGFRAYHGRRDEKDLQVMREAGRRFMARIEDATPPDLDEHTATLAALKRLHPDLDNEDVEVPPAVAAGYERAVAMVRKAEALKDRYDIALRAAMGRARRATVDGRRIATHVISDVPAEKQPRGPHRKDYLLPPRERKTPS